MNVAVITSLSNVPPVNVTNALALIVVVAFSVIVPVYCVLEAVGTLPFVV